jgi:hypothetical protein
MTDTEPIPHADAARAAEALNNLTYIPPTFLPPIVHWEIHQDEQGIQINGQLADETRNGSDVLAAVAAAAPKGQLDNGSDRILRANFVWIDIPVSIWWMPPILRWIVPPACATCPTELGAPDVPFVRLGTGQDAPVICIPCRDLMHQRWITAGSATASEPTRFLDRHGDTWETRPDGQLELVRLVGRHQDNKTDEHTHNWRESRDTVERDMGPLTPVR